ncbi:MAG: hypothetical protein ACLQU2_34780 [Candidatus Binataceae bacterium]
MRTRLTITDNAGYQAQVNLYGRNIARNGVYVVAKLSRGDLVALDRDYYPMGFLAGHEETLFAELLNHPATFHYEADASFQLSAGITHAEAIWFDLD